MDEKNKTPKKSRIPRTNSRLFLLKEKVVLITHLFFDAKKKWDLKFLKILERGFDFKNFFENGIYKVKFPREECKLVVGDA